MECRKKNRYTWYLVGTYRHFLASIVVIEVNRKSNIGKNGIKHSKSKKSRNRA